MPRMRQKKGARGRKAKSAGLSLSYRQAEEEDMEIQRQLQEAHSRIAALKAQVKREQQMRRTRERDLEGKNVPATDMEKEASEDDSSRAERLHTELKELANGSSQSGSRGGKNGRRSSKERPRTSESSRSRMRHSSSSTGANLARPKTSDSSSLMSRSAPLLPQGDGKTSTKKSLPKNVRVSPPRPATSSGIPGVNSGRGSKKSPKMKRRPATASSSLSPTRKLFTEKHFSQAQAMPLARLQDLLKQKVFKEAIRRKGIEDHELVPRPPASFRVQANRASLLSPVEAQLHFEAFEKRRMQLLAMVLAEWEVCEGERKKEDARLKKEEDKLTSIFHNRLSSERNRLQNIVTARTKVEGVQLVENKILKGRRKNYVQSNKHFLSRLEQLERMKESQKDGIKRQGQIQAERRRQVTAMKDKMIQMRAEEMMKRFQKRDKLLAIKEAEKKEKAAMKRRGESEHQQRLALKQEHAKQVISERTQRLQQRLAEKTFKVKQIQAEKKAAVEAKRIRKALRTKQRLANAERARKEAAYRKSLAIRKIHASWKRMEKLKEIEEAIRIERGKQRKQEIIARHKWKAKTVLERSITPGPGQYHNNKTDMVNTAKGAKWGEQQPKSEIDWIMYRAGQIPGPGNYTPFDPNLDSINGGTWGRFKPKSDVEWMIYRAKQLPGPGEYEPEEAKSSASQTFGNFDPPGEIDKIMTRARQLPGPSDYSSPTPPLFKPTLTDLKKEFTSATATLGFISESTHDLGESTGEFPGAEPSTEGIMQQGGGGEDYDDDDEEDDEEEEEEEGKTAAPQETHVTGNLEEEEGEEDDTEQEAKGSEPPENQESAATEGKQGAKAEEHE